MKKIEISGRIQQEAKNIIDGVYAPLKGFVAQNDLESILENMRLADGTIWPMPIVWDVGKKIVDEISDEKEIALVNRRGEKLYLLKNPRAYQYDKSHFAQKLYGTLDLNHPGVAMVMGLGDFLVSGEIFLAKENANNGSLGSYLCPADTKRNFSNRGWKTIAAFQTRNAPHRSHEHLQLEALKYADGLFINPIIGDKKKGDFNNEHILGAYQILIDKHHPKDKVLLGTFHAFMRYAGPKEAVFHALVRRNFGCTHMIIGRDHAGVGDYYDTYAAQKIFDNFGEKELGIKILKFENAAHCSECGRIVFDHDCSHKERIHLSGTELRRRFQGDEFIPSEFMRKEIIEYLRSNRDSLFVK